MSEQQRPDPHATGNGTVTPAGPQAQQPPAIDPLAPQSAAPQPPVGPAAASVPPLPGAVPPAPAAPELAPQPPVVAPHAAPQMPCAPQLAAQAMPPQPQLQPQAPMPQQPAAAASAFPQVPEMAPQVAPAAVVQPPPVPAPCVPQLAETAFPQPAPQPQAQPVAPPAAAAPLPAAPAQAAAPQMAQVPPANPVGATVAPGAAQPQAPMATGDAAQPQAAPLPVESVKTGKPNVDAAVATIAPIVDARIDLQAAHRMSRRDLARDIKEIVADIQQRGRVQLNLLESRDVVTVLLTRLLGPVSRPTPQPAAQGAAQRPEPDLSGQPATGDGQAVSTDALPAAPVAPSSTVEQAKLTIQPILLERMDISAAMSLPRAELARQIGEIVLEITTEQRIRLNTSEQRDLVTTLINDMLGLGPLEPLLADETITDIMVNGINQVYVERRGKLELSHVKFRDNAQLMNICSRIVTAVGRRIDDSSPLVDARLADGSRVNIIIPPLAIDGAAISIRKFSKKSITLDMMAKQGNMSPGMATVLKVAARCQLNILISGGTGSGKTTLLNAMSQLIDHGERVVTIEDAAELQLQQPHVVRLETRPPNIEGQGEIDMRDLVKNALRMRPDRIIMGEVRGGEAVDMLQAMNTGHEGSMCTLHANRPREALTRLENMVGLAGVNLSPKAVRTQIAAAVDLIAQVSRMRDGVRRITSIVEIVGMEDEVIVTQELFNFHFTGEDASGRLTGEFKSSGLRPHFAEKAEYFNLDRTLLEAI